MSIKVRNVFFDIIGLIRKRLSTVWVSTRTRLSSLLLALGALAFAALIITFACGNALADRPAPRSISLDIDEISVDLTENDSFFLTATVSPDGASSNFKWWSSDTSVLTVEDGMVTLKKPGEAVVNVSVHGYSDVKAACRVTVTDSRTPERIVAYPSKINAEPGERPRLHCVVFPQSAGMELKYSTSNATVATVDENGVVNVLTPGNATITVKSAYSDEVETEISLKSEYGVRIKNIALSDETLKLEKGDGTKLRVNIEPENATGITVFTSSDESVASVDEAGNVTTLGFGESVISVSSYRDPSISANVTVYVSDINRPESLAVELDAGALLRPGDKTKLNVMIEPAASVTNYTIASSRDDIVSVNGDELNAVKRGVSRIRVQSAYREDLFYEFTVTVEDGTNALQMPLRTTDEEGIDENLALIANVEKSALDALYELYDAGQIGKKEFERRTDVVKSAFEMYAFPWTVESTVKYWKAENSENGAKDFKPGVIYYGLPYTSGENHNRAYNVSRALEQRRYLPVNGEKYYIMNPDNTGYASGYAGNDCSAFVAQALWGYTVYGEIVKTGTLYYDDRLRAFTDPMELKAGDILVRHSKHVVMFLYWADEDRTQAVFIQQGGYEPGINTVNAVVEEIGYYVDDSYRLRRLAEY